MPYPNIISTLKIDEPQTLIAMMDTARPAPQFLLDRYFPCNEDTDVFPTEKVLIDYRDKAGRKLAPLVHAGHKSTDRRGFYTEELTPARIAPVRKLTLSNLIKRQFAEGIFSGRNPEDRALRTVQQDLTDLQNDIKRRLEYMAADLLINNKYTLTYEKSDDNGESEVTGDVVVSFIDSDNTNEAKYTPAALWTATGGDALDDIKAMARQLDDNGGRAQDLILGSNAADALLKDERILKLMDIRRIEMGSIAPQIAALGATLIGMINVDGILLNVIEYHEKYTNSAGTLTPFIPASAAIITSPNSGRSLFGAVTQIDGWNAAEFTTHPLKMVPKYLVDAKTDSMEIQMTSRPLLAPVVKGGWVSATVTA